MKHGSFTQHFRVRPASGWKPQGHWVGSIRTPRGSLGITVDLAQPAESPWVGKISIPAQGLKDFVLSDVAVDGDNVSFAMKGVPGSPRFRGRLSKNFDRLSGDFSQGGGQFRFSLERSGDVDPVAVVAQKPTPPQIVGVSGKQPGGFHGFLPTPSFRCAYTVFGRLLSLATPTASPLDGRVF